MLRTNNQWISAGGLRLCYIFLFVIGVAGQLFAQSGCPGCTLSLPDSLGADTIYLGDAADGVVYEPYSSDLSFRMPMTTTAVANAGVNVPPGLNISEIEILSVRNLPPGLSWETSQSVFAVQEETDGCVRFCGTPLLADSFFVEVVVKASLGILFSQETSFVVPMYIAPSMSSNDGFSLVNTTGCGEVTTTFTNEVPSNGQEGYSYRWDFGDGTFSEAENPGPRTYSTPGVYPIQYLATIDTTGYFLNRVTVLDTDCGDAFNGAPDLKINVLDPSGEIIYVAPIVENADVPLAFPTFIELGTGIYSVEVIDDDNGLGGADDICGIVTFSREGAGVYTTGGLELLVEILHPVDSIATTDTIIVYPQPEDPIFSPLNDPLICPSDSVDLMVTNFTGSLAWSLDSNVLALPPDQTSLRTNVPGRYEVIYTSPDGCQSAALAPVFDLILPPDTVVLENFGNLVQVFDNQIPPGLDPRWYLDGEPLDENQLRFCASQSGTYTLELTDVQTGCRSESSISVTVDPDIGCDITSVTDPELVASNWTVFPNPANVPVHLSANTLAPGPVSLNLVGLTGCSYYRGEFRATGNGWTQELPLPELAAGSYFLIVTTTKGVITLPLLRN